MLDNFFDNLDKVQKSTASFTLELMPHDELIPEIDEIINLCYEKTGAKCHITVGRADYLNTRGILSDLSEEDYIKTWSVFDSAMFDLKMKLLGVKRKEFCYAGAWSLYVNIYTGEASACYGQAYKQNIFENPDKPINFCPVGKHCVQPYCINGHAHMSLGLIPEYDAPTYAEVRNRTRTDGSEWFSDDAYEFFNTKLYETNREYNWFKKKTNFIDWYLKLGFPHAKIVKNHEERKCNFKNENQKSKKHVRFISTVF